MVRLVGIEPTPLAPEASALSTGLQALKTATKDIIPQPSIHVQQRPVRLAYENLYFPVTGVWQVGQIFQSRSSSIPQLVQVGFNVKPQ